MQDTHHLNLVGGSLATAPTLGLAPPGYEIPPLRGWLKPLQDPTPVKRARTVTRMPGVLNHARFPAFLKISAGLILVASQSSAMTCIHVSLDSRGQRSET